MSAYYRMLLVIALMATSYLLVAFDTHPRRNQEFFPFFTWSLFSYSSDVRTDFTLAVSSVDGVALEDPEIIISMMETFPRLKRDHRFRKIVWSWVSALHVGDTEKAERLREIIEHRYFASVSAADYELVAIRYRPLERYRDREQVEIVKSLGAYSYAGDA